MTKFNCVGESGTGVAWPSSIRRGEYPGMETSSRMVSSRGGGSRKGQKIWGSKEIGPTGNGSPILTTNSRTRKKRRSSSDGPKKKKESWGKN